MAQQVQMNVLKTDDNKYLLQVGIPASPAGPGRMDSTVYEDLHTLAESVMKKLDRQFS